MSLAANSVENAQRYENKPLCLLVIGMAGAGKTSFVKALQEYLNENDKRPYVVNLDPAVYHMPYEANIDIRDTINYKEVMKELNLGPNGAILTSLNMFATKMNGVIELIDAKSSLLNYVIIDTPGQIEVFKWSASGKIITQTISSTFPTAIVYVIDSSKCTSPLTFMSNMLYASGVAIEHELPFVMVMNKNDIIDSSYLDRWMSDVSTFIEDLDGHDLGYSTSMTRQLALVLDTFYMDMKRCGVSSFTGQGLADLDVLLKEAREEFFNVYLKEVLPEKLSNNQDLMDSIFISSARLDDDDGDVEEHEEDEEDIVLGDHDE